MSIATPGPGDTKLVKPPFVYIDERGTQRFPEASAQPGWNASAGATIQIPASGSVEFYIPTAVVGVIVGFGVDPTQDYGQLTHGIYCSRGVARAVQSGALIGSTTTFTGADALSIVIAVGGGVTYKKNGTTFYTSAVSATGIYHRAFAFLYAANDAVWNMVVTQPLQTVTYHGTCASTTGKAEALGANRTAYKAGRPLVERAMAYGYSGLSVAPAFTAGGADTASPRADGVMYLPVNRGVASTARARAIGSNRLNYTYGLASTQPAIAYGTGARVINASVIEMLNISTLMSTGYELRASIIGTLGGTTLSVGAIVLAQSVIEMLGASTTAQLMRLVKSIISSLGATDLMVGRVALLQSILSRMSMTDRASAIQTMQASVIGRMALQAVDGFGGTSNTSETWVVNTDKSGGTPGRPATFASLRYENFDFNSFARFQGTAFGARGDGIYLLEGDDDAGKRIKASVDFGKQRFGTSAFKRVPAAYVGTSSSGKLFMRVTWNDNDYIYAARSFDEELRTQRFDLGKGLKANYIEFELYNGDGEDFDLDTVEFIQVPLDRRI